MAHPEWVFYGLDDGVFAADTLASGLIEAKFRTGEPGVFVPCLPSLNTGGLVILWSTESFAEGPGAVHVDGSPSQRMNVRRGPRAPTSCLGIGYICPNPVSSEPRGLAFGLCAQCANGRPPTPTRYSVIPIRRPCYPGVPRRVRIVHVSDTHNTLATIHAQGRIPDGDILVHTGDATNGRTVEDSESECAAFGDALAALPHRFKLVVAGNHDIPHPTGRGRQNAQAADALAMLTSHVERAPGGVLIHESWAYVLGLVFAGHPFTNVDTTHRDRELALANAFLIRNGARFPPCDPADPETTAASVAFKGEMAVDVLLTHMPVAGHFDHAPGGGGGGGGSARWGCKAAATAVMDRRIPLALFGHVHSNIGVESDGLTLFSNAAMLDGGPASVIDIVYMEDMLTYTPAVVPAVGSGNVSDAGVECGAVGAAGGGGDVRSTTQLSVAAAPGGDGAGTETEGDGRASTSHRSSGSMAASGSRGQRCGSGGDVAGSGSGQGVMASTAAAGVGGGLAPPENES